MAGRPKKVTEVSGDIQEVEIEETVEETEQVDEVEVVEVIVSEEPKAPIITPTETPKASEVTYNPKDIVEFYNLKGDLRYAPYAYITKRGYTALRKYTKKKVAIFEARTKRKPTEEEYLKMVEMANREAVQEIRENKRDRLKNDK